MPDIPIPIDSEIVGELFLRSPSGPKTDVAGWIETIVTDFLERTADEGYWSEAYYAYREQQSGVKDFLAEFGNPKGGYHWAPLFLPNGTLIRMTYMKEVFNAAVRNDKIEFKGGYFSPSELAHVIANKTRRNAWRDLLIKRPGDTEWLLADDIRRRFVK